MIICSRQFHACIRSSEIAEIRSIEVASGAFCFHSPPVYYDICMIWSFYTFIQGGARLQSIANICYSFLMITVNVILIVESIRSLVEGSQNETNDLHVPSLVAVAVALATKFSLFCFCWTIKASSSQVQILWEDHRNDLPVNTFGILTNAGGAKLRWWIGELSLTFQTSFSLVGRKCLILSVYFQILWELWLLQSE